MKNLSFIHILLLILMLLVYHCTSAQDYVLTVTGDTLRGTVKPVYGDQPRVQLSVEGEKKKIFTVTQVREFNYKDQIYRPVSGTGRINFMKLVKPGYLSLYAFQQPGQTSFDSYWLLKRDGEGMEVPNLTFKHVMKKFVDDCPEVSARIESGEWGKRHLNDIVDAYNTCIQNNTAQIKEKQDKLSPLDVLENKVKGKASFEGQKDALDMITEIKGKVGRKETVPKFMIDGLKNSLSSQPDLSTDIENALNGLTR